jgi:hypothetical protein
MGTNSYVYGMVKYRKMGKQSVLVFDTKVNLDCFHQDSNFPYLIQAFSLPFRASSHHKLLPFKLGFACSGHSLNQT